MQIRRVQTASPQGSPTTDNTFHHTAAAAEAAVAAALESPHQPPPSFSSSTLCSAARSSGSSRASSVGSDPRAGGSAHGAQGPVSGFGRNVLLHVNFGTFLGSPLTGRASWFRGRSPCGCQRQGLFCGCGQYVRASCARSALQAGVVPQKKQLRATRNPSVGVRDLSHATRTLVLHWQHRCARSQNCISSKRSCAGLGITSLRSKACGELMEPHSSRRLLCGYGIASSELERARACTCGTQGSHFRCKRHAVCNFDQALPGCCADAWADEDWLHGKPGLCSSSKDPLCHVIRDIFIPQRC